jgi:hypothetical protein
MEALKKTKSMFSDISMYVAALALIISALTAVFFYRELNKTKSKLHSMGEMKIQVDGLTQRLETTTSKVRLFDKLLQNQIKRVAAANQASTSGPAPVPVPGPAPVPVPGPVPEAEPEPELPDLEPDADDDDEEEIFLK